MEPGHEKDGQDPEPADPDENLFKGLSFPQGL